MALRTGLHQDPNQRQSETTGPQNATSCCWGATQKDDAVSFHEETELETQGDTEGLRESIAGGHPATVCADRASTLRELLEECDASCGQQSGGLDEEEFFDFSKAWQEVMAAHSSEPTKEWSKEQSKTAFNALSWHEERVDGTRRIQIGIYNLVAFYVRFTQHLDEESFREGCDLVRDQLLGQRAVAREWHVEKREGVSPEALSVHIVQV